MNLSEFRPEDLPILKHEKLLAIEIRVVVFALNAVTFKGLTDLV